LADARKKEEYTVYCTYDLPYMREIFGEKFRAPAESDLSIVAPIE
jgi:hypothetical protein